jgi:ATP-dependent RNA helicase DDX1
VKSVTDNVHPPEFSNLILNQIKRMNDYNDLAVFSALAVKSSVDIMEIQSLLIKVIKQQLLLKIIDKFEMSQCMIFCRTNLDCDNLETFLCLVGDGRKFTEKMETGKEHRYSCCVLGGLRSMEERRRNLDAFKSGYVRFLICTDVAARGIDIQALPYVINMTLPDEAENYIHRIGRVGRVDKMGLAISIVAVSDGLPSPSDNSNSEGSSRDLHEKVWYHTCSNRGKDCTNRTLKSQGGCTIWLSEAASLRTVQQRLGLSEIPELGDDFSLPQKLAQLGITYGEVNEAMSKGSSTSYVASYHKKLIESNVTELANMETQAQNLFLTIQSEFLS